MEEDGNGKDIEWIDISPHINGSYYSTKQHPYWNRCRPID
jgi:hypothetical protein